jgi:hypothetical protein
MTDYRFTGLSEVRMNPVEGNEALRFHPPRANEKWNTCLGQFRVQVGHAHDLIV